MYIILAILFRNRAKVLEWVHKYVNFVLSVSVYQVSVKRNIIWHDCFN